MWIWAGRKGDHILRNEIKIPRNQYNVDFKVKFVFTQSGLCVLMFIQVRSMHTQPELRKAWWFLPPVELSGIQARHWTSCSELPGKSLAPQGHSTHRRRCAPAQCPAAMAEHALREYFQKQLFVVSYGMKFLMITEGLIYSVKHEMGQLLSFHFTLLGSGPVRRGVPFTSLR